MINAHVEGSLIYRNFATVDILQLVRSSITKDELSVHCFQTMAMHPSSLRSLQTCQSELELKYQKITCEGIKLI